MMLGKMRRPSTKVSSILVSSLSCLVIFSAIDLKHFVNVLLFKAVYVWGSSLKGNINAKGENHNI